MNSSVSSGIIAFFKSGRPTYFACLLSVIILPIHVDFLPPFMILWVICWLWENAGMFNSIINFKNESFLLFIGFFLFFIWYVSGLLYTTDLANGKLLIFRRLSLILFPLVLVRPGKMIKDRIMLLLKVFSISTLLYIVASYGFAMYRSLHLDHGSIVFNPHPIERDYDNYFFGTDFAFSQHPTYLAMYVILSVFIAFESTFNKQQRLLYKISWLVGGSIMLSSLYFISSRAGILSAIILIPFYLIIHFRKINKGWVSVFVVIGALTIFIFSFLNNNRIKYYLPDTQSSSVIEKLKLDNRVPIWRSAIKVIRHNLFFGVGAGDASAEIRKAYKDAGYTEMYYDNLNAHNQYLEILLANGLVGLLIMLSVIAFLVYKAILSRNLLLGLYISVIIIFFLFESVLNRIAGVTFFSLFSFLLMNLKENSITTGTNVDIEQRE
jgi:O-antigen ligase